MQKHGSVWKQELSDLGRCYIMICISDVKSLRCINADIHLVATRIIEWICYQTHANMQENLGMLTVSGYNHLG